ncbi:Serine/threonine-protein kinase SRPK, partial [Dichanthelium oligosanthes]
MASLFGNGGYSFSSGSEGEEDEDEGTEGYRKGGYHAARPGDRFAGGRFVAQRKLGWGNFSTVWLAYDTLHSKSFAGISTRIQGRNGAFDPKIVAFLHIDYYLLLHMLDSIPICDQLPPFFSSMYNNLLIGILQLQILQRFVALKIQKSARDYAHAALHEIELLSAAAKADPTNSKCVVRLLDHFKHAGPNGQHVCLVTEFLGDSLLRLIRYNRNKGIGLSRVKEICRSLLVGLDYLHSELGIIHTDLKPENVLLVLTINPAKDPVRSGFTPILDRHVGSQYGGTVISFSEKMLKMRARRAVAKITQRRVSLGGFAAEVEKERSLDGISLKCKIVDFGNACWADQQLAGEIQTRQYRAPEVIIGSGYSYSADMWSFACIAFELATGDLLFAPKICQGCSEDEIASSGTRSKDYFDRYGDLKRIRRLKFWPLDRVLVER